MSIIIDQENKVFTLQTQTSSYQMKVGKYGHLLHTYYGSKLTPQDLSYLWFDGEAHFAPYPYEAEHRTGSLDLLPQEYPTVGTGDLRTVALDIENEEGTHVVDLRYKGFVVITGKYRLDTLPTFFSEQGESVDTLKVILVDASSNIEVELYYGVFEEKNVITRATKIINKGSRPLSIRKAQSLNLDLVSGAFDLVHFQGRWSMERQFERLPVAHSTTSFGSNYGLSGNRQNPGFLIMDRTTSEENGNCYGFNLVYSGNFTATAERSSMEQTRVTLGMGDGHFSWRLELNETFETPEAIMSFSSEGLAHLSHQFHDMIRENLCQSKYTQAQRPVLINNWEATYFDFTGEKLVEIARASREIGVDLLVMDDGWFGQRWDDNRALGDWSVNEEKLGMSLGTLARKINQLGLKFGIWFEPEMVNEESELYREHPEWVLNFPRRKPLLGRNQLVLDFSKKEVIDDLFEKMSSVLDSAPIEYVKWDMNRAITDWFSSDLMDGRQGELQHRYVLGLYDLLGRLTQKYPQILFEGCSSGGARFDLGMLSFHPQIWTSDNTDAINRLKIQYGTSFFYPVSTMGTHISAVPNHQNGRVTSLATRAHVAMAGTYGYELDVTQMTESEKEEALAFTASYKAHQMLIFGGDYYRLTCPFEASMSAWQVVSKDRSESLVTIVATDVVGNAPFMYLKLRGLECGADYSVEGQVYSGSVLMNAGLKLPQAVGNAPSLHIEIKKIKK